MIIVYTRPALLFNIYHDVMNFTDKIILTIFFNFCIFHYSLWTPFIFQDRNLKCMKEKLLYILKT